MTGKLTAMSYSEEERRKVAEIVRRTRIDKGLDKEPAARAAGINSITWKRVEDSLSVRDASLTKILSSLGLPSADDLLNREPRSDSLPPLSTVQPFRGTNSLRWRAVIEQRAESERSEEEVAWLAASKAEQSRLTELMQRQGVDSIDDVVDDAEWIPTDAPASRQPRWSNFKSRSFEEIFNEWQSARARVIELELEYAIGRRIPSEDAPSELEDILKMLIDNRNGSGRPWTPPWDPGPEFLPGDEPWKASWWASSEEVDAGHLGSEFAGHKISRISISTGWDPNRVRAYHAAQSDEWAPGSASPSPNLDPKQGTDMQLDLAARTTPGESEGRRRREAQDEAAERTGDEG